MPHPDDEALSAYYDGESDDAVASHVSGCPACKTRLAAFAAIAAAVGQPVQAPPEEVRDIAIAAALDDAHSSGPSRSRPRVPVWAIGIAAGILALAVAVPLLRHASTAASHKSSTAARSNTQTTSNSQTALSSGGFAGGSGRDLGAISDTTGLVNALRGIGANSAAGDVAAGDQGQSKAAASGATAPAESAVPAVPAPAAVPEPAPCLDRASAAANLAPSAAVSHATLRWKGDPAVAWIFARPGQPSIGVVTAADGCQILVTVTL